ncbi:sigma 54-interacting transcriptional regulator [bacterium]|nr:sigma 54-interacting transcriptional regulator [bacterium]
MSKSGRKRTLAGSWLNASTTPMFMLDAKRRIVLFNAGCEKLTGWLADEVIGETCEFAIDDAEDDEITRLTCSLCPPLEAFEGQTCTLPTWLTTKDGKAESRQMNFFPVLDDDNKTEYIIAIASTLPAPETTRTTAAQKLHAELAALRTNLRQQFGITSMVAQSPSMKLVLKQIAMASQTVDSILVIGKPGTGREHIARVIHTESDLSKRAFIPIDCAATDATDINLTLERLLVREPDDNRPAHLRAGTIFFANADRLPRDVQESIVKVISAVTEPVRIVVGSAIDANELLASDQWRDDFRFMVSTININLPSLADRRDDVLPLAQFFLEQRNRGSVEQLTGFDADVQQQFFDYAWPGNLDELREVVAEARAASDGNLITAEHLPFRFRTGVEAQTVGPEIGPEGLPLEKLLAEFEVTHIRAALAATKGNKSKAAELLGLKRASLLRRIKALGIE